MFAEKTRIEQECMNNLLHSEKSSKNWWSEMLGDGDVLFNKVGVSIWLSRLIFDECK